MQVDIQVFFSYYKAGLVVNVRYCDVVLFYIVVRQKLPATVTLL